MNGLCDPQETTEKDQKWEETVHSPVKNLLPFLLPEPLALAAGRYFQ